MSEYRHIEKNLTDFKTNDIDLSLSTAVIVRRYFLHIWWVQLRAATSRMKIIALNVNRNYSLLPVTVFKSQYAVSITHRLDYYVRVFRNRFQ